VERILEELIFLREIYIFNFDGGGELQGRSSAKNCSMGLWITGLQCKILSVRDDPRDRVDKPVD
jgi:hypothetical protein